VAGSEVPAYEFKTFENKAAIDAYISDANYFNATAGFPGICFGYEITENSDNDYSVDIYMND